MKLELEHGSPQTILDPERLARNLRNQWKSGEGRAILSVSESTFIQALKLNRHGFLLEYQDGGPEAHFYCVDEGLEMEDVIGAFVSYARGTSDWKLLHRWEEGFSSVPLELENRTNRSNSGEASVFS